MRKESLWKGPDPGGKVEEMFIIFKIRPRHTEEWLSSDKFKDKTAEAPYVKGIVDGPGQNQFGSSQAEWCDGLCRGVGKEVCCEMLVG